MTGSRQPRHLIPQSSGPAGASTAPGVHPRSARFVIVFASCLLLGFALLFTPFLKPAVVNFSRALVDAAGSIIGLCGGSARVEGTVLRDPASGFAIEMKDGCNGVNVTILLWAAVLAFPASWIQKAKGLLMGSLAIQSINVVRFISLFYLGQYSQAWFDFAHQYLWESLIILDALVIFSLWVHLVFRSVASPNAHG